MKISFLGAGAIGAMFGGLLRRANPDWNIHLIVRGQFGEELIRHQRVTISGPWGNEIVPVRSSSDFEDISDSDFVFVTVKSQDTRQVLESALPFLGKAIVVSIQNGINDSTYADYLPLDQHVMGMTSTNVATIRAGHVSLQLDGTTLFGSPSRPHVDEGLRNDRRESSHSASERVVDLFRTVRVPGLYFASHHNILGIRYNKLSVNALGYASCLSDSNFINEAIGSTTWRQSIGKPIVTECREVLSQSGIKLERMPGRSDLSRVERLMRMMEIPVVGQMVRLAIRSRFEKSPIVFSLLQDLRRGKPTEVDFINGQFAKLASQYGGQAPINQIIVSMTHELERKQVSSFYTIEDIVLRIKSRLR